MPLGAEQVEGQDYVVVYKARYNAQTAAVLRVLREAGCAPVVLGTPPHGGYRGLSVPYVPIAVPKSEVDIAAEVLVAWEKKNKSHVDQLETRIAVAFLRALRAAAISAVVPVIILAAAAIAFAGIPPWAIAAAVVFWLLSFGTLIFGPPTSRTGLRRWLPFIGILLGFAVSRKGVVPPQAPGARDAADAEDEHGGE
jgi:hypothetical protein